MSMTDTSEPALVKRASAAQPIRPHKIMTPEEYGTSNIQGWHAVCRNYDGFGGVAICYFGIALPSHEGTK